ncbi:MAG: ATP-grasp domain-containing protein [Acidobacteriota bacterium]|nr:ATP-grasp domain-containing protein [Acidobacteriota bacterium]
MAVVVGPQSFPFLDITQAAEGVAGLIWLADLSDERLGQERSLLARAGQVMDLAGITTSEAADRLRPWRPDGILTFVDELMPFTADLARALSLPFYPAGLAAALADKVDQRTALRAAGVPGPDFRLVPADADPGEVERLVEGLPFPAVLKPRVGTGGRFTTLCDDATAVSEALRDRNERREEGGLILEEMLGPRPSIVAGDGPEAVSDLMSVDTLVIDGRCHHVGFTRHLGLAWPFRRTGSFLTTQPDHPDLAVAVTTVEEAVAALGVDRGWLNVDVILTADGPRVVEVNGRVGGGVPRMLHMLGRPNPLSAQLQLALGGDPDVGGGPGAAGLAYMLLVQPPPEARSIVSIWGVDRIMARPGVVQAVINKHAGDPVDWRDGSPGFVVGVYGTASSVDQLLEIRRALDEHVAVEYRS